MKKTETTIFSKPCGYVQAFLLNPRGRRRSIRIVFRGPEAVRRRAAILESLDRHHLVLSGGDGDAGEGFAVVFFDTVDPSSRVPLPLPSAGSLTRILGVSTGNALEPDQAWGLIDAGFSDLIAWQTPQVAAAQIAARLARWDAVEAHLESDMVRGNLIGRGQRWKNLLRRIIEVACFTDASVLILGPSGTGKELVARLIHTLDRREPKQELVIVDCATLVPELSGSEFFGHTQGAYTGAVHSRAGAFQIADGGTLFLDEVGDLPPSLQAQLLRVIQEGSYKRIGDNQWRQTRFRLICATNRDLRADVEQGRFRADLYYRLSGWVFDLPPLSERTEDILPLAHHFLAELDDRLANVTIDAAVHHHLLSRAYPGNIRELRQLVRRIGQRHVGAGHVSLGDLPEDERPAGRPRPAHWRDNALHEAIRGALAMGFDLKKIHQLIKDAAIDIVVAEEQGNLQKSARRLGVTDRMLQMHRAANRD